MSATAAHPAAVRQRARPGSGTTAAAAAVHPGAGRAPTSHRRRWRQRRLHGQAWRGEVVAAAPPGRGGGGELFAEGPRAALDEQRLRAQARQGQGRWRNSRRCGSVRGRPGAAACAAGPAGGGGIGSGATAAAHRGGLRCGRRRPGCLLLCGSPLL